MEYKVISGDSHLEVEPDRWTHRVPADEGYKMVAGNAIDFFHLQG